MKYISYKEYQQAVETIRRYKFDLKLRIAEAERVLASLPDNSELDNNTLFSEVKHSVRLAKILQRYQNRLNIVFNKNTRLQSLENIKISHFVNLPGVGEATILELKEIAKRGQIKLQP